MSGSKPEWGTMTKAFRISCAALGVICCAALAASSTPQTRESASALTATTADFYVATNGNDGWSGTLASPDASQTDGPFATLARAQSAVQALKLQSGGRTTPIVVLVRGGNYYLSAPLNLTAVDSGAAAMPILYEAYPNEIPILSGGKQIVGWQQVGPGQWQAPAAGLDYFEQLFVGGVRRYRPRTTTSGYLYFLGPVYSSTPTTNCDVQTQHGYECTDRFYFKAGDVRPDYNNLQDVEVDGFENWTMTRMKLKFVDTANSIAYLTGPVPLDPNHPQSHGFNAGHRYLVENVKEAIGQPGQWYLDRTTKNISYFSEANEDPNAATAIAPQASQLVVADGLSHVTFKDIVFSHTNWVVPAAGHPSQQGELNVTAALSFTNSSYVTLDSCTLTHIGGYGVEFVGTGPFQPTEQNPYNNRVINCVITDLGAGGIRVGLVPRSSDTDASVAQYTLVQNNVISGGGRFLPAGEAVYILNSHHNLVDHNDVYDFYNSAISTGFSYDYNAALPSLAHDNVIQFNHIYQIGQGVTSDIGAAYMAVKTATGNQILNNKIHDVTHDPGNPAVPSSAGYGGWGIYFDAGSSNVTAKNNLVYRTSQTSLHHNFGQSNTVENNIFAFGDQGLLDRTRDEDHLSLTLTRNIFYWDTNSSQASFQRGVWSCVDTLTRASVPCASRFAFDFNLYWFTKGAPNFITTNLNPARVTNYTIGKWQALGEDEHSICRDPLFGNPQQGDFSLQAGSPASDVEYVAFDPGQAGRQPGSSPAPPALAPAFPIQGGTISPPSPEAPVLTALVIFRKGKPVDQLVADSKAKKYELGLTGSGFDQGSTVLINAIPASTTLVSATQLSAKLPFTFVPGPGQATVQIRNADGQVSGTLVVLITN